MAGRHNLDLQDMRRVLDVALWADADDHLPHVGLTEPFGYTAKYEWTGAEYAERPVPPEGSVSWLECRSLAKSFRAAWLAAHAAAASEDSAMVEDNVVECDVDLVKSIRCGINEAFCDGINSGFYINSYTTKPGPGLAGMLEELQRGGGRAGLLEVGGLCWGGNELVVCVVCWLKSLEVLRVWNWSAKSEKMIVSV